MACDVVEIGLTRSSQTLEEYGKEISTDIKSNFPMLKYEFHNCRNEAFTFSLLTEETSILIYLKWKKSTNDYTLEDLYSRINRLFNLRLVKAVDF